MHCKLQSFVFALGGGASEGERFHFSPNYYQLKVKIIKTIRSTELYILSL